MKHVKRMTKAHRPALAAEIPINTKDACVDILPGYLEKECKSVVKAGGTYLYYIS